MQISSRALIRIVVALVAVAISVFVFLQYRDKLDLEYFIEKEAALEALKKENLLLFALGAFGLYFLTAALSFPGAGFLTIVYGKLLGVGLGTLVVSFASTFGATVAFLISRFVVGDSIREKYGSKLDEINRKLEKEGPFYLFTMRLIPAFPFFLINLLMGLTPMKAWTFWWVSQLGMLAGTLVYTYAGSQLPNLETLAASGGKSILTPGLIIAFVILGIFPFVARKIMSKIRPKVSGADS